jgi:hypothetical protein
MKTPNFKPVTIHTDERFKYVLSFEEEDIDPKRHFIKDCGWSRGEYSGIANHYWFTAKVTAYMGKIECANTTLGGCSYKSLAEILGDKTLPNILGGYAVDMVAEVEAWAMEDLGLFESEN